MDKWEKRRRSDDARLARLLGRIYDTAAEEAAAAAATVDAYDAARPFAFRDFPKTGARVDDMLQELHREQTTCIVNGIRSAWTLANDKNDALCDEVFGRAKASLTKEQERRYYATNGKALDAFTKRKIEWAEGRKTLSARVWDYTDQFLAEMEDGIGWGLRTGQSAADMARDLKRYLREPDRLFRRVRDERGVLRPSKAMRSYHPGRGVYRSSYKNALRMSRTENNAAYRTADHLRWADMDFVVGIEIHLSGNHPVADICDDLAGRYPKDFRFTGWHPQCRCYATTVLKTEEELAADNERIVAGEEVSPESVNTVDHVPDKFKEWVKENDSRIAMSNARGTLPYFLKDNRKDWADISTVKIINYQSIGQATKYASAFGNKAEDIASSLGVTATPVNIKSESRILEKAISDYRGDVAQVADIIRNTFIVPAEDIQRVLAIVQEKFSVIRYKPQQTSMGYSGHLFQVWAKDGIKAEIQVNTPQMIYAKEPAAKTILGDKLYRQIRKESGLQCGLGHKYYEEYRILSKADQQAAKGLELRRKSQEYYERIRAIKL